MGGPVADIHGTIGAEFWGVMLATALWGVTCMQTWWYYDNYPNDHRTLKVLVAATWISDTVHEALILHIVYEAGISNFGDVESLDRIPPFLYLEVLFNALTGLFVQLFLTFRIWTLRRNLWLVCVLVVSIVAGFVVSLLYMIFGLVRLSPSFSRVPPKTLQSSEAPASLRHYVHKRGQGLVHVYQHPSRRLGPPNHSVYVYDPQYGEDRLLVE
ncbi:hypothetical protein PM082_023875 [Marasmius tenuissimus]|nr:hypothetical protein PM082_023875 [Marasmius tenuissimus]